MNDLAVCRVIVAIMASGRRTLEIGFASGFRDSGLCGFMVTSRFNGLMLDCRMGYRLQGEFERQSGR